MVFERDGAIGPQIMAQLNHDDFLDNSIGFDSQFIQAEADFRTGANPSELKACHSAI